MPPSPSDQMMQRPDSKEIEAQASTLHFMHSNLNLFFFKEEKSYPAHLSPGCSECQRGGRKKLRSPSQRVAAHQVRVAAHPPHPHGSISKSSGPTAAAASNGRIPQPPSLRSPPPVTRDPRPDPTARGALNSKPSVPGSGRTLCQPTTGINSPQRLRLARWETRRGEDATPEARACPGQILEAGGSRRGRWCSW